MGRLLTKSALLHATSADDGTGGYREARDAANTALANFDPIHDTIDSKTIWMGEGQPEAVTTLQISRLGLNTTAIQMDTGAQVVIGLSNAIATLRSNLEDLNDRAKSQRFWVEEDGTVVHGRDFEATADSYDYWEAERLKLEAAIKQTLSLATAADLSAKTSFEMLTDNEPFLADTAYAPALKANQDALDRALADRQQIVENAATWQALDSLMLTTVENIDDGVDLMQINENNRLLGQVIERILSEGHPMAGPVLDLLKGDVDALLTANLMTALEVGATLTPEEALARLLKIPARVSAVAGAAILATEVVMALVAQVNPDGEAKPAVIDGDGTVKAHVDDQRLASLASGYYSPGTGNTAHDGSGTIADLAYQQRLNDRGANETDWVGEAEQTRSNLLAWLSDNKDSPDAAYAEGLVKELDIALGDVPIGDETPIAETQTG
ncbi:MAG: hypothetical protein GEV10_29380 [Streptosporangiales bacterium]|nr:hypothetical protein [Streptosporangiales bacterium]